MISILNNCNIPVSGSVGLRVDSKICHYIKKKKIQNLFRENVIKLKIDKNIAIPRGRAENLPGVGFGASVGVLRVGGEGVVGGGVGGRGVVGEGVGRLGVVGEGVGGLGVVVGEGVGGLGVIGGGVGGLGVVGGGVGGLGVVGVGVGGLGVVGEGI